jgi:uncharacterized protein YkwD
MASPYFFGRNFKNLISAALSLVILGGVSSGQSEMNSRKLSLTSISDNSARTSPAEITRPRFSTPRRTAETPKAIESAESVETKSTFKSNTILVTSNEVLNQLEREVFDLLNRKRQQTGLPIIAWSDEMAKIARLHSENMARFKFFSHSGLDGLMVSDRADALGITRWVAIGENIAFNRGYEKPAEFACARWMLSPTHRDNILNPRWKETGVGAAVNADGAYYFTQVFVVR